MKNLPIIEWPVRELIFSFKHLTVGDDLFNPLLMSAMLEYLYHLQLKIESEKLSLSRRGVQESKLVEGTYPLGEYFEKFTASNGMIIKVGAPEQLFPEGENFEEKRYNGLYEEAPTEIIFYDTNELPEKQIQIKGIFYNLKQYTDSETNEVIKVNE